MTDIDIQYTQIDSLELEPNCYSGSSGDEVKKQWLLRDRSGTEFKQEVKLNAAYFPPGTRITISVPMCPNCQEPAEENCPDIFDCECGFSWGKWTLHKYS